MKVLIVDDDAKSRKILRDLFKIKNIETVEAENGKKAIDLVSGEFKICILDIILPDMDGSEVARQIKEKCPQIVIVAHTASALKEEVKSLEKEKLFDCILLKPIELTDFEAIMARYIE